MTHIKALTAAIYTVIVIMHSSCYASTLVEYDYSREVNVPCSPTPEDAIWQGYNGIPGITMALMTIAMKHRDENGTEALLYDSDALPAGITADVRAKCIVNDISEENETMDMFPKRVVFQDPEEYVMLICPESQGIIIKMTSPNNDDPAKYQYVGMLGFYGNDKYRQKTPQEPKGFWSSLVDSVVDAAKNLLFSIDNVSIV